MAFVNGLKLKPFYHTGDQMKCTYLLAKAIPRSREKRKVTEGDEPGKVLRSPESALCYELTRSAREEDEGRDWSRASQGRILIGRRRTTLKAGSQQKEQWRVDRESGKNQT